MVISNILYIFGIFFVRHCHCEILNDPVDITLDAYVLWPNATVPFYVNKDHFDNEQENIILTALKAFERKTCLKFLPVPTMPTSGQHVLLFENPNGVNRFTIPPWGHSVDEPHRIIIGYKGLKSPYLDMMIMKALGFPFEHNSKVRKDYVRIQYNNIEQSYLQHFAMETATPEEFLQLYDHKSVMHFKSYQFTKNGQRTIVMQDPNIKDYDNMAGLTNTDLLKIQLVYGPECLNRDRKEKIDVCQILKTGKRAKRSVYAFPRKSLRVNPEITPPPMLDSAELDRLNITDVVKEITEHVQVVSGLIVKIARAKFCNVSLNEPYEYVNDERIKEAIDKIEHHAKIVIEQAQTNSKDFCDVKPDLRACGFGYVGKGSAHCTPGYKSTKSGNVKHSTKYKAILQSTNVDRLPDKHRVYYPHLREGVANNDTANSNVTETKKEGDGKRLKREAENKINNLENSEVPSRRLVKKSRMKSTVPPLPPSTTTTIEMPTTTTKVTITEIQTEVTETLKPKAEEDDYEVVEVVENESETVTTTTITTPVHQKRFKKKYVDRLKTDNKEADIANFNQHQSPITTKNAPNKIFKQVTQRMMKKSTPVPKEILSDKYESSEEEVEEDGVPGVKNVKVIMEYNTAGNDQSPAKVVPQIKMAPQITERQDEEEEESSADANEGVEEPEPEAEEADDAEASGQAAVIPEQQINTPTSEIFVNQFQPDPVMNQKKKTKHKQIESSAEEEERTTRKPHKPKTAKNYKPMKPQKTRIIGPGAPSVNYQSSANLPKTIRLNKKNLEFYNERKWLDPVITYVITEYQQYDTDDLRRRLDEVIRILKRKTCIRLQEVSLRDAEESFEDYLVLDTSPDYVTGRVGGKQHFGSVELFEGGQHRQHAAMMIMAMLGFYFEVARHDRDQYVRVHLRHVRADKLHHFEKIRDDATFPLPYDYQSATHPAWQFWRKLGKKGISTVATYKETDPSGTLMKTLGQNPDLLSDYDIIKINTIYGVDCFMKSGLKRDV